MPLHLPPMPPLPPPVPPMPLHLPPMPPLPPPVPPMPPLDLLQSLSIVVFSRSRRAVGNHQDKHAHNTAGRAQRIDRPIPTAPPLQSTPSAARPRVDLRVTRPRAPAHPVQSTQFCRQQRRGFSLTSRHHHMAASSIDHLSSPSTCQSPWVKTPDRPLIPCEPIPVGRHAGDAVLG